MSIEALLVERYKVIAPYPHSPYKVGDVIKPNNGRFVLTVTSHRDEFGETVYSEHLHKSDVAKDYPHLLQPLPWWAERKPEEMPRFIKWTDPSSGEIKLFEVYKWVSNSLGVYSADVKDAYLFIRDVEPATEADYTAYITQTKK
jgi:hypothetical protein